MRWTALLDMLAGDGRVEIDTAAERLGVSAATVRRDLDELASQQLLVRTRGGAVPHSVSYDLPLRYKLTRRPDEKRSIAEAAAELVVPGSVVGLNGGTTTTEVARALVLRSDLGDDIVDGSPRSRSSPTPSTSPTSSPCGRRSSSSSPAASCAPSPTSSSARWRRRSLERLTLDLAILGVDGISVAGGACTNNESEAAVNELMARQARTVVVVADSSKLGRRAFARICPIDRVDILVTGALGDGQLIADLRDAGVDVITVRCRRGRSRI